METKEKTHTILKTFYTHTVKPVLRGHICDKENWQTVSLAAASRVHPFCNLQIRARTQAVLVIGLYELLDNPTT
jgi:hypothetical protein